MSNIEKLLCDLIALPSVNPAFLPAQDPHAGEQRVGELLTSTGAKGGLDVAFQAVFPGRANLLARLAPSGRVRQRILLAPHLDTVNAPDEQFNPSRRNGRLFGRGACDTKGSVAAMFTALCDFARSRRPLAQTELVFAGLVDEENGQAGSRALAASGFKADLAIVGEPTRLQAVTAHKGSMWLQLETRGKSAHGATPELGRNAVRAMARVIELLEGKYAAQLRRPRHPLLGCATVSVGVIAGGTQANIVPDHCTILVDRRTLPGETEKGVAGEIGSLLRKHNLRATLINGKLAPCLPLETNPQLPLIAQFFRSIGQSKPVGVHYFCDASVLSHGGIPSIAFGPGDIAQAHTADEWISLESLARARRKLTQFFETLP